MARYLTKEEKKEIIERLKAGEVQSAIARDYGCSRANISLIYIKHFKPEQHAKKAQQNYKKRLTPEERETFIAKLKSSTPEDHNFIPHREHWSIDHGRQLAEKLFNKTPAVRVLKEIIEPINQEWRKKRGRDPKPQPPKPACIEQLDPELAKDKDFVKYYLSETSEKIRWRTYELALEEWEQRNAGKSNANQSASDSDDDWDVPDQEELKKLERINAQLSIKRKGRNFTPSKRRKRKKKK